ncbi:MAG: prepilin-type N-terminal cleavage/methylation domain-containing protein [Phycisphaerae bacterium]|nr:prepilin-type N-terminal cleavage/methylation domain-containing protein [Phycisphaerae bacterium]
MSRRARAFTFVELMVALVVTSVILSAVATLAFAMSRASTVGDDYAGTQAQIRHATIYLSDLVARCRLICAVPGNDLVVWRADDNDDGRINANELVYIERGDDWRYLHLSTPPSSDSSEVSLPDLSLTTAKAGLLGTNSGTSISLIADCNNVEFGYDQAPPATEVLVITFGFEEEGRIRPYEIVTAARCRAKHLLNEAGNDLVSTDDD